MAAAPPSIDQIEVELHSRPAEVTAQISSAHAIKVGPADPPSDDGRTSA